MLKREEEMEGLKMDYNKPGHIFLYILEVYKDVVIKRSPILQQYEKILGRTYSFLTIIESYFFGYDEWIALIPILNHHDALPVVEIYRAVSFLFFLSL